MIAFDADVLSEIFQGNPALSHRAAQVPIQEQTVPVVVIEEIMRGRLHAVRNAEAAKGKISLMHAYELLKITFNAYRRVKILSHTPTADDLFKTWRSQGIRIPTHDLRIAAICVAFSAKLATRNGRDFEKVPGLEFEVWS